MFEPQSDGQRYALGWNVQRKGKTPVELIHSGALASNRALLRIHLPSKSWVIVLYALRVAAGGGDSTKELAQRTQRLVRGVAADQ
jgi:hypothetical protein